MNMFKDISKEELCQFLGIEDDKKTKKKDLEELLLAKFEKTKTIKKKFLKAFDDARLGLSPEDFRLYVGCTKTERLRWQNEGKLKIVGHGHFKYGDYPLFSRYQAEFLITPEKIASWRKKYEEEKKKNKAKSIAKASKTRQGRVDEKKAILDDLASQKEKWAKISPAMAATFELAFWTVWTSRLAKSFQVKERHGKTAESKTKYYNLEQDCYSLKDKAIQELVKSPYSKVSFYRPANANKIHFYLCPDHYDAYVDERQFYDYGYYTVRDFFEQNKQAIKDCEDCVYEEDKDYYSLYYLEVKSEKCEDVKFSFHVPYPVGNSYMGDPKQYPKVKHEEQDGMFRFGRPLEGEENYIFTMAFVQKKYDKAMEAYKNVLSEHEKKTA